MGQALGHRLPGYASLRELVPFLGDPLINLLRLTAARSGIPCRTPFYLLRLTAARSGIPCQTPARTWLWAQTKEELRAAARQPQAAIPSLGTALFNWAAQQSGLLESGTGHS
jgi:hypothetical protein